MHDLALRHFMVGNHHLDFSSWRAPMVASVGAYSYPHQDFNGLGVALYCAYDYKAFFLCYNNTKMLITPFFSHPPDDIDLGWEHMFDSPHKFGSLIICPSQMLYSTSCDLETSTLLETNWHNSPNSKPNHSIFDRKIHVYNPYIFTFDSRSMYCGLFR